MKSKHIFGALILTLSFASISRAQLPITVPKNQYGLEIIASKGLYNAVVKDDSSLSLLSLTYCIPNIKLDLRYASKNNFMGHCMYPKFTEITFLRMPAAYALKQAEAELEQKNMHFKVFDAYRPYSVTEKFWKEVHDERYVANPAKGSGHNKGLAVDLTIIDSTGKELDMGTGFDNFTDSAHHSFNNLPINVLQNRQFLKSLMVKYGFKPLDTEWWHYSFNLYGLTPLYNLSFKQLKKL